LGSGGEGFALAIMVHLHRESGGFGCIDGRKRLLL